MTGIELEERIGYKIVRCVPCLFGKRRFFSYNIASPSKVEYFINKWAYPDCGCGPLAVFGTKEDAVDFLKTDYINFKHIVDSDIKLFRCKYTSSNDPMFCRYDQFYCFAMYIPKGTEKGSRVMMIEEIDLQKEVKEIEK